MPRSVSDSSTSLIDALLHGDDIARETAAARLAIRGRPAVRGLVSALEGASAEGQTRILGLLERIGAPGALAPAARLLQHERTDVALAALAAVAVHVVSPDARTAARAIDALTALALDPSRDREVRTAAFDALAPLDAAVTAPLRDRLAADPTLSIEARRDEAETSAAEPLILQAGRGALPDDPDALRHDIARQAARVPLTTLYRAIVALREREGVEPDAERLAGWRVCRAAAHQALAARGSRLAVYDAREAIEQLHRHAPVGFLTALTAVGDASCLDTLATAWTATDDPWFRQQVEAAFGAIVVRERLTRRHAVAKRIASNSGEAFRALWKGARPRT